MGEVVAKQFSALGQEVPAFFFFLSEQFIMLWSLARHFAHRIPLLTQVYKWVLNNFQANLKKLYGGKDTSFRTIWLRCKMFLFSNHLCSWAERDSGRVKHFAQPINLSLAEIQAFYLEVH